MVTYSFGRRYSLVRAHTPSVTRHRIFQFVKKFRGKKKEKGRKGQELAVYSYFLMAFVIKMSRM